MKRIISPERESHIVLFVAKCPLMWGYKNLSSGMKMESVYMILMNIICYLISIRGSVIVDIGEMG